MAPFALTPGLEPFRLTPFKGGGGFTYYVNPLAGSDSNDGRGITRAFATWAAAAAVVLSGQSVGVVANSHLRELAAVPAGVTVGWYGVGDEPKFNASDVADNGDFSADATPNVYNIDWTNAFTGDMAKVKHSVWVDGVRWVRVASKAALTTHGQFYAPAPTAGGTQTISIYSSTNPASDGKVYEISRRLYAITVGSGATVEDLYGVRSAHADGVIVVGTNGVLRRCTAEDGTIHNVYASSGALCEDVLAWKIEVGSSAAGTATMFVAFGSAGISATFRRCIARGAYHVDSYYNGNVGFYGHTASGTAGTLTFEDCIVENCFQGFGGEVENFVVTGAITTDVVQAVLPAATTSITVAGGFFDGDAVSGKRLNRVLSPILTGGYVSPAITFAGNVVTSYTSSGGLINGSPSTSLLAISNNTFVKFSDGSTCWALQTGNALGNIQFSRNIFVNMDPVYWNSNGSTTIASNNNVMFPAASNVLYHNVDYATVAAYQSASGLDAASSTADPAFVNSNPKSWASVADAAPGGSAAIALQAGATFYEAA